MDTENVRDIVREKYGQVALRAKTDRPESADVVLCLNGAEPPHDIRRVGERRSADVLIREPESTDVHVTTRAFSCAWSASSVARKQWACVWAVSVRFSTSSTNWRPYGISTLLQSM